MAARPGAAPAPLPSSPQIHASRPPQVQDLARETRGNGGLLWQKYLLQKLLKRVGWNSA